MNIYLDVDGVLIAKDSKLANYANEFIKYILANYPNSTYWLTTRCQGDAGRPVQQIGHLFDEEALELLKTIKPTTWETITKAGAIDFTKPFLWFDDNLFISDRQVLADNGVLDNWIPVDLRKDPDMLKRFIEDFPLPINLNETI